MLNAQWFALVETLGRPVQPNQCFTLRFAPLAIHGIKDKRRSVAMWTHWEELRSLSESALQAAKHKKHPNNPRLEDGAGSN
jgi:hypothetical protein